MSVLKVRMIILYINIFQSASVCCLITCKEYESKINFHSDIPASFRGHSSIRAVYRKKGGEIFKEGIPASLFTKLRQFSFSF